MKETAIYRIGFPGWRLAARVGVPLCLRVQAFKDDESNSYWAKSDDLNGLVVSGTTLDELQREVMAAVPLLLQLEVQNLKASIRADLQLSTQAPCAA